MNPDSPEQRSLTKIYVLGDSISIQYGPYLKQYLSGIMDYSRKEGVEEAMLNLDNPLGANGGDSSTVLSFLKAKARFGGIDADVLLLNCGLHDIKTDPSTGKRQVPLKRYEENLRSIIQIAKTMSLEAIWVRTTPCDENVHNRRSTVFHRFAADCDTYNRAADRIMAEAGIPTIDLYRFTLNLGSDLYCDHVHFHEPIREKQGAFIAGWLTAWQANHTRPIKSRPVPQSR
jgi:lysophospholipase L1-like esterase